MAMAERRANVTWTGTLAGGEGLLELTSGATGNLPVTWASRTERSDGKTSPEELIAAAHASCFAMALSGGLGDACTPPERLHVAAVCTLDQTDAGLRVTRVDLKVRGKVPGLDAVAFAKAAAGAKEGCPVSNALKGNVEITVEATLE
jgi:osmotically inducible protein OsmC